jgi:pyruvate dehydrogenase E2 component (dihydrolipoamide acetyltransferase)
MAEKVAQSRREIPDATTWVDVDATALVEARDVLHSDTAERPIGLLALVARITIAALARFPALNSSVDVSGSTIAVTSHPVINLGFAVQTSRGLVVPVIHGAGKMSTSQLATEMGRLTLSAHNNGLTAHDLTGGTFTVNNYGVFGVDGSTPIVNYPEAAILGLGRIIDKPWVVNGSLAVRKVGQLSLTFDHRVCDGATAGGFLRYVADGVESPLRLLADM